MGTALGVRQETPPLARRLAEAAADVMPALDRGGLDGWTALHWAAACPRGRSGGRTVAMLLQVIGQSVPITLCP